MSDAAPRHTTVISSDQPVAEVRFVEAIDDGRWFRLLNWLVDSGVWASLPDPAKGVLIVLARHASLDGTSLPSHDTLMAQSGLSRSGVFKGLSQLRSTGVIEPGPRGSHRLFPGREFAGRRRPDATHHQPTSADSPPRWTDAPRRSTAVDRESTAVDCQSTAVDPLLRRRLKDVVVETGKLRLRREPIAEDVEDGGRDWGEDDGGGVIDALMRRENGSFRREDASRLVEQYGADRVRDAIASGQAMKARGKLRKTMREFVVWFLGQGMPLFREVEEDQRKQAAAALVDRLGRICAARLRGRPELAALLEGAFGSNAKAVAAGAITPAEAEPLSDDEIFELLLERAERHQSSQHRSFR